MSQTKTQAYGLESMMSTIKDAAADVRLKGVERDIANAILDDIFTALLSGRTVQLKGIGVMKLVERKARKGRNPSTGETIQIPARKVLRVSESAILRNELK